MINPRPPQVGVGWEWELRPLGIASSFWPNWRSISLTVNKLVNSEKEELAHSTVAGIYLMMTMAIAILILNYSYAGAIAGAIGTISSIFIVEVYFQTALKSQDI